MRVFFASTSRPAEILKEIIRDGAVQWKKPIAGKSCDGTGDVYVGKTRVFLNPSEYGVDGYEFTAEDLQSLLDELKRR